MDNTPDNLAEEVLAHHGILGMKWGVRRYQNKDGSLTSLGRKHYDVGEKRTSQSGSDSYTKSVEKIKTKYSKYEKKYNSNNKTQKKYYDEYIKNGATPSEAKARAYRKYAMNRALLIGGGVAVASVTAAALYKHHKYVSDVILKADVPIKRITRNPSNDLGHQIYATFNEGDSKKYLGLFSAEGMYQSTYKSIAGDLKIAGHKTGKDTMNALLTNNKDLRKAALDVAEHWDSKNSTYHEIFKDAVHCLENDKPLTKKAYEALNIAMFGTTDSTYKFNSAVTNALKEKGYAGILDITDQKYHQFKAKSPAIFFDHTKIKNISNQLLDKNTVQKAYDSEIKKLMLNNNVNVVATNPITLLGGGAALTAAFSADRIYTKQIMEYRKEHPDTKKDYYELLYLAKKGELQAKR